MSASISVDLGSFDLHLSDLAETVVTDCMEGELLEALARELERAADTSDAAVEVNFGLEGAKRLRYLAEWFKTNEPGATDE